MDDSKEYASHIEQTLRETEREVLGSVLPKASAVQAEYWESARNLVSDFQPVPWFIWRLANFVIGKPGVINDVPEGMVLGLKKLMVAAASDEVLGHGRPVKDMREALKILQPDTVAAISVIHAICRRLASKPFDRIWRPILDDAILRARIGYYVGMWDPSFGAGRGMLAGFSGRSGLVVLIASGEMEQAAQAIEQLAAGAQIADVGKSVYGSDPLTISSMLLSASGCGRSAAFGTARYASHGEELLDDEDSADLQRWLSAYTLCERVRRNDHDVDEEHWLVLNFSEEIAVDEVYDQAKKAARRGHGWDWIL